MKIARANNEISESMLADAIQSICEIDANQSEYETIAVSEQEDGITIDLTADVKRMKEYKCVYKETHLQPAEYAVTDADCDMRDAMIWITYDDDSMESYELNDQQRAMIEGAVISREYNDED